MAKSFICTIKNKENEYAYIYTPRKVNGKKDNSPVYLGRVVDKEHGVFQSRARGIFTYNIENGYSDVGTEAKNNAQSVTAKEEKLILNFGDTYCLYEILKTLNLHDMICNIVPDKEHHDVLLGVQAVSYPLIS